MINNATLKSFFLGLTTLVLASVLFVGCSKSDNEPGGTSTGISGAVGTFKGKLTVYTTPSVEYFDAIVSVSKAADNKLTVTVKSGEVYSLVQPKTFQVNTVGALSITAVTGSPEGHFIYTHENKSLNLITMKQSATEIQFAFEGTKQ